MLARSSGCTLNPVQRPLENLEVSLHLLTLGSSDTIANIEKLTTELATDIPCDNIFGLVIYDLPGRDCAAKASNGELAVGELDRYKTEYIDGTSVVRASLVVIANAI